MKDNEKGGKTAKGIKKNVMKKDIKHEDYKNLLFNNKQICHKMKTIRSYNHRLESYGDDTTSYAYGYYKIQN